MAIHRPIAYIKKDLEKTQKERAQVNKETNELEMRYNKALIERDENAKKIEDAYVNKKAQVVRLDREVQKLEKELKDERRRLNSLER